MRYVCLNNLYCAGYISTVYFLPHFLFLLSCFLILHCPISSFLYHLIMPLPALLFPPCDFNTPSCPLSPHHSPQLLCSLQLPDTQRLVDIQSCSTSAPSTPSRFTLTFSFSLFHHTICSFLLSLQNTIACTSILQMKLGG